MVCFRIEIIIFYFFFEILFDLVLKKGVINGHLKDKICRLMSRW